MSTSLLSLSGVQTHIGTYHILHGVDLEVPSGCVTMLLGRNGAGKTTCLRTIMQNWRRSGGSVHFEGVDLADFRPSEVARLGIAYVPENMGIFGGLTVRENLLLAARSARNDAQIDRDRLRRIFEQFPALERFWQSPAGSLSGGQKQMLAIARALIEPRRLLLIDEPSKGLAPAIVETLIAALDRARQEGTTILLVEQNLEVARRLGDFYAVMDNGRIVQQGAMSALVSDPELQTRLLGFTLGNDDGPTKH
jgi:branched-chain amino acid transport system ATP-binding protein